MRRSTLFVLLGWIMKDSQLKINKLLLSNLIRRETNLLSMMKFQLTTPEHEVLSSVPTTRQNPRLRAEVSNKHHLLREVYPCWWAGYSLCRARQYQKDFFHGNPDTNSSNPSQSQRRQSVFKKAVHQPALHLILTTIPWG